MGAICTESSNQSAKYRATLAAIYGQFPHQRDGDLRAISAERAEWMEAATIVFSPGYDSAVGSLLHDSPVSGVLWASCSKKEALAK